MILLSFTVASILQAIASILQAMPCEYEVYCGDKPIPGNPDLTFVMKAQDGTVDKIRVGAGNDDTPVSLVIAVLSVAEGKETDFAIRRGRVPNSFIISGTKKSPLKSLVVESEGWKPVLKWVPLPPPTPKK